ncbi:LysM peptidoglycan-binding domain-containing protein [Thermohalobacter berrensis]|uniref:Peptidoglycan-binding protein n=1 Tax=Thermohalobacter berrensis TaxID=99594 RepID=A0A419SZA6_9FIRM|nr:LysM peptidoglycan-binding domain-containing protein [Thermohalobacter berrensis]RKD30536.1 peptidoglycan-binding protein [Thermohalobacter berrensis]
MPNGCPPRTIPYTIRPGDTLYRLAIRYNTTVPAIVSANPFIDPRALRVGSRICIPTQPIYPACPEGNYYFIKSGDTLYSIARFYNVSLADLIEANPGIDPNRLSVGQVICIPLATPPVTCPEGTTTYTIQRGDTFYSIARRYGITVRELREANPNINPNALLIGQKICIPQR